MTVSAHFVPLLKAKCQAMGSQDLSGLSPVTDPEGAFFGPMAQTGRQKPEGGVEFTQFSLTPELDPGPRGTQNGDKCVLCRPPLSPSEAVM